jgi:hypothetical protein
MVGGASGSHILKEFDDGVLCHAGHAASGAHRTAFDKASNHLCAGCDIKAIHTDYYAKAALVCQG